MLHGRCQWQKRGKAFLLHSIQLLLATPDRHEVWVVFLVTLKHHLQSSKVGVKNLLSFSISSWLSSVWKNKMGRKEWGCLVRAPRDTAAVRSGSRQRGWESHTVKGNFFNTALNKLCLRKFLEILCVACNLTILHNFSLCLSVTYFYFLIN